MLKYFVPCSLLLFDHHQHAVLVCIVFLISLRMVNDLKIIHFTYLDQYNYYMIVLLYASVKVHFL